MSGLGYTLPAIVAVIVVCALELAVLHTGLFRRPAYWISMVIVTGFQIPVDGWLTKLSSPIVIYDDRHTSGIRFPLQQWPGDFMGATIAGPDVVVAWPVAGGAGGHEATRCHHQHSVDGVPRVVAHEQVGLAVALEPG